MSKKGLYRIFINFLSFVVLITSGPFALANQNVYPFEWRFSEFSQSDKPVVFYNLDEIHKVGSFYAINEDTKEVFYVEIDHLKISEDPSLDHTIVTKSVTKGTVNEKGEFVALGSPGKNFEEAMANSSGDGMGISGNPNGKGHDGTDLNKPHNGENDGASAGDGSNHQGGFFSGLGDSLSGAAGAGIQSGIINGFSVYAYRKLVYDDDYLEAQANLDRAQKDFLEAQRESASKISEELSDQYLNFNMALQSQNGLQNLLFNMQSNIEITNVRPDYSFKTTDPEFRQELQDIRNTLWSSPRTDLTGENIRSVGLDLTEWADSAHAEGDVDSAEVFKEQAKAAADLLFGLDPITGTGRDIYEAITGYNLITGEKLTSFERGMAVVGSVSFGFGSKIGKGIKAMSKVSDFLKNKKTVEKAIGTAKKTTERLGDKAGEYAKKRLWQAEKDLHKYDPANLARVHDHPRSNELLGQYATRKDLIIDSQHGEVIKQGRSLKSLEAADNIANNGVVVRQGRLGLTRDELGDVLAKNPKGSIPLSELKGLRRGSKLTIGNAPGNQSNYFGTLRNDVGSEAYSMGHGTYGALRPDYIEISKVRPDAKFITRETPPGIARDLTTGQTVRTPGGGIEAVIESGGIEKSRIILIDKNMSQSEIQELIKNAVERL